ncbi:MAG: DUF4292 domain-containing protein [Bacteroidales bacterium]|nr:DUF4292 domain-containing protein [Bacteroidales bacterium]
MYHKIKYIVPIIFLVLFFACTFRGKISKEEAIPADIALLDSLDVPGYPFNSVFIAKSPFRLDHNDHYRSLKSTIYAVKDSILIITIKTPLGTKVAKTVFEVDSICFYDLAEKRGYIFDYQYLGVALGLDVNFITIQNLLFGLHSPKNFNFSYSAENSFLTESDHYIEGTLKIISQQDEMNSSETVYFNYSKVFSKLTNYRIYTDQGQNILSLIYIWGTKVYDSFPHRIEIDFNFFDHIIGIDFDFKSIKRNPDIFVSADFPDIKVIPLALDHEVF